MDCLNLLKAQQRNFCRRLEIGNLLISRESEIDGESYILSDKAIEKVNLESLIEAQNIVDNYLLDINPQDVFNLSFYKRLAIETFLSQFGDVLWLDTTNEDTYSESSLSECSFIIKNNDSIKLLLKIYHGSREELILSLDSSQIEKHQIFVFMWFPESTNTVITDFKSVFLGFLSLNLLNQTTEKKSLAIKDLLYIGGLRYYLSNDIAIKKPLAVSAKNYLSQGQYNQAIQLFNQLIQQGDGDDKDYFLRGLCQCKLGNRQLAIRDFLQTVQLNHRYSLAYHWLGFLHQQLEDYEEALKYYNQEISFDNLNFFAYFNRAVVRTKLNNLIDALEDYSIAAKINNEFYQLYYNRGHLYARLGDNQSAIADYKKALHYRPDLYQAYYNLGVLYQKLSNYQEAIQQYKLAIQINRRHVKSYYNLAILQANLGLYKKSLNHYKEALKIDINFMPAHYNHQALVKILKNEGHLLLDSQEFISSLEQTPGIISLDDDNMIDLDDEDKYTTISIDKSTDNFDLNSYAQ